MAETIGLLILSSAGATASVTGIGSAALTLEIAGATFSVATAVGTAAIAATAIGLSYALNRPSIPKPSDGSVALKQAIPPRIKGYGINRLAGYYMLFEANGSAPATSYDVLAIHSGKIHSYLGYYLNDDEVTTASDISLGGNSTITASFSDGRYNGGAIKIETALGEASQTAAVIMTTDPIINAFWTVSHRGDGIAWLAMVCGGSADPSTHSRIFPKGHPELSVLARCSLIWDPRDGAQSYTSPSTWTFQRNPVLHLINYLTASDGGMGLDLDTILPPDVLALWMVEATLCDQSVLRADSSTEPRYQSDGWYKYDNNPSDVISAILSTCDGWMTENGDGSLALKVGVYRSPSLSPITTSHLLEPFSLNYGLPNEQLVNQFEISFTDPDQKYVEVHLGEVRDEDDIAASGITRSKQLSLPWVQSFSQAGRLGYRGLLQANPKISGTFTTTLYGLRYLGERWLKLQYPFVAGLEDCVVEIRNAEVDLLRGRITWTFALVDTDRIEAYDASTDEIPAPVAPALIT
jgi:hypothetical protein